MAASSTAAEKAAWLADALAPHADAPAFVAAKIELADSEVFALSPDEDPQGLGEDADAAALIAWLGANADVALEPGGADTTAADRERARLTLG